jgi:hypothetical protein
MLKISYIPALLGIVWESNDVYVANSLDNDSLKSKYVVNMK